MTIYCILLYKYTKEICPKNDTWFSEGGRCGWAHVCNECKDNV